MAELGNIFDPEPGSGTVERGPDLRTEATLRRADLGRSGDVEVRVPLRIDGLVRADPHGDGERIRLSLPANTPDGATVRLRGLGAIGRQGERRDEGRGTPSHAGDLYLVLRVVEGPASGLTPRGRAALWIAAAGLTLLAAFLLARV